MIAECMIFLASVLPLGVDENTHIVNYLNCDRHVPASMQEYAEYYVEHFEFENLPKAVRIGWCESRGVETAYRSDNRDSGIMQFIPTTWNWIAEKYDLPKWNEWVIMRWGKPYTENKVSKTDIGFEQVRVQFSPYWNIKFASLLAEEVYNRTQWKDWNSSKWCWGNPVKWNRLWNNEERGYNE